MATTVSVRLPEELVSQLDEVAGTTDRSKSYLIKKAIEQYLEDYVDLQIVYDRIHDPTDKTITSAELRKLIANDD